MVIKIRILMCDRENWLKSMLRVIDNGRVSCGRPAICFAAVNNKNVVQIAKNAENSTPSGQLHSIEPGLVNACMNSQSIKRPDQNYSPCAQQAGQASWQHDCGEIFFIDHHSRQDYIGKNNTRLTLLIQLCFWLQRLKNQSSGVFIFRRWLFFIPFHSQRELSFILFAQQLNPD